MATHIIQDSTGKYHVKAATQREILDLAASIVFEQLKDKTTLGSPAETREFFKLKLSKHDSERFCVLYLDSRNAVIELETPFYGTVNASSVHPREIIKRALYHNATAVILAHNHPSGDTSASESDKRITSVLKQSLAVLEVRVLDHLIVGDNVLSFAEHGYI